MMAKKSRFISHYELFRAAGKLNAMLPENTGVYEVMRCNLLSPSKYALVLNDHIVKRGPAHEILDIINFRIKEKKAKVKA